MTRRPPRATPTDTLLPCTTRVRSRSAREPRAASTTSSTCSDTDSRIRARRSSSDHSDELTPITGTPSANDPSTTIWYSAGYSFFFARSPVAPKSTTASDRSDVATSASLPRRRRPRVGPHHGVAAELLAQGGDRLHGQRLLGLGFEAGEEGGGDGGHGHPGGDRGLHRPPALAGVGGDAVECHEAGMRLQASSDERRVVQDCDSTSKSRWWQYPNKQKI